MEIVPFLFLRYLFVRIYSGRVFDGLRAVFTQEWFTSVTCSFRAFLYALRAGDTQYRSTGVLGRCVLLYFMNHMGHA